MSEAEFITAFQDVVDESTVFAPTDRLKPVGAECAFSLELADGTAMLRGLGLIVEAWSNVDSPFGRPGMKIEIDKLTPSSQVILEKLVSSRAASASRKPRQRPNPSTYQLWALTPPAPATEEMVAADPDVDEPGAAELPRTITRELRSAATPLADDRDTESGRFIEPKLEAPRPGTVPGPAVPAWQARSISSQAVMPSASAFVESSFDPSGVLAASRPRPWWMNARVGGVFAAGLVLGIVMSLAVRSGQSTKPTAVAAATQERKVEPPNCPAVVAVASEPTKAEPAPCATAAVAPAPAAPTKSTTIATATKAVPTTKARAVASQAARTTKSATVAPTKAATAKPAVASNSPAKKKRKIAVRCTSLDCL